MTRLDQALVGAVARLPFRVQTKLLSSFLVIVALLIALGAVGLQVLTGVNERTTDLIRLFLEKCDDFGGTPVFYEVNKNFLHQYADFGLTFVKLVSTRCFSSS